MSVLGCVIPRHVFPYQDEYSQSGVFVVCTISKCVFISVLYQTRLKLPSVVHLVGSPMSLMKLHLHLTTAGETLRVASVGHALALRYDHKVRGLLHRNGAYKPSKLVNYVGLYKS